jgi:two-component system sensor histidine kinase UhpB
LAGIKSNGECIAQMTLPRKLVRVLLVEDSQDDADLVLLELSEAGFDVVCKRVETEAEMREALPGNGWNVVISDFNLPQFSARKALAVLREADQDIPFVIVSGCIGEESAVALMKEGVSNFDMKDKLARLTPVIEREFQDATMRREHRHAQDALRANEKLLREITGALGEGVYVLNVHGTLVFMNPEAERLLGWTETELIGQFMHNVIHLLKPDGTPLLESCCGALGVMRTGDVYRTDDDVFVRKDGSLMPVSFVATPIMEGGKAVASVIVFQDISQRKQAEWNLLESSKQLRELASYLQTVREEERTRIARELHDEFGQMLTGIKLDAKWLASFLPGEQPGVANRVTSMFKLIDETMDSMRRVAADLRPVMLDDLGLVAAVEWLAEEFGKRTGIGIRLELDAGQSCCGAEDINLDKALSTAAFRIVQECLTNVARHAEAQHVHVLLKCRDSKLILRVTDDGRGMPAVHEIKRNSYGIMGMQERSRSLGGTLDFSSVAGKGTRIEVILPIKSVVSEGVA